MLYHAHELQHAALAPMRLAAEAGQLLLRNPFNPLSHTGYGRALAAACEIFEQSTRRRPKPAFGLASTMVEGREVAVTERIVHRKPLCQLKRFARDVERDDPKLLIVAPLSGHFATLLRGTVRTLLPEHDVYITDWRDARMAPLAEGPFDLDDYIDYMIEFLRLLGPGSHVMAVCQPSVPVLAATALMAASGDPATPRSLVLMGGPVDTRVSPTQVNRLAEERPLAWFEGAVISRVPAHYPGFLRRVYPGFVQLSGFMSMNLEVHMDAKARLFEHLVRGDGDSAAAHRRFYDEYTSVMDLPAEYYLQTVATVFQNHDLPLGRMRSRGRLVEPAAIAESALMTVEGERDDITGRGQTRAAHELCARVPAARRVHYEQQGVGHYGIFSGRRWRDMVAPRVRDFIRQSDRG
jgi:poly(3-hydroxybutyrate) depolymerase